MACLIWEIFKYYFVVGTLVVSYYLYRKGLSFLVFAVFFENRPYSIEAKVSKVMFQLTSQKKGELDVDCSRSPFPGIMGIAATFPILLPSLPCLSPQS